MTEGAGDAEDRERLSEVEKEREDESFLNIVDSFDLVLCLPGLVSERSCR